MVEVRDVVKRYGDHVAVDHLSFRVEKGQIYGFLGPNGAMDTIFWKSRKRRRSVLDICRSNRRYIWI